MKLSVSFLVSGDLSTALCVSKYTGAEPTLGILWVAF